MSSNQPRQTWSSRLTYILTVTDTAVGFGTTWCSPYLVSKNGGGAYVFPFRIAMLVISTPMILVENVIGRRKGVNALNAFGDTMGGKPVAKVWKLIDQIGLISAFGIMAYYMVPDNQTINCIINIIGGNLDISSPVNGEITESSFTEHTENNPWEVAFHTLLFVVVDQWILVRGIIGGIGKVAKYLMSLLFLFLIAIVMHGVTLPGTMEGITFYLKPDFSKITAELFVFVLGQVFFTPSLGFGVMITLSSYLDKNENLVQTVVIMAVTNTIIAVLTGLTIFPSLFSSDIAPNSSPALIFQSLPIVFSSVWTDPVFVVIFFSLLLIATLTASLTIYEVLIATIREKTKVRRVITITVMLAVIFIFGNILSVLSCGPWKDVSVFGKSIFDAFNCTSGSILFMLTALGSSLFVGLVMKGEAKDELFYKGNRTTVNIWFAYVKYLVSLVILLIFIGNLF